MKRNILIFGIILSLTAIGALYTRTIQKEVVQPTTQAIRTAEIPEAAFDQEAKKQSVVNLVERGIAYFIKNRLHDVGHVFTHTKEFIEGELYLFLLAMDGTVIAHGQDSRLLWDNLWELRDDFGTPVVQTIINKAKEGGGWVTYEWRGAIKVSYVKKVTKEGRDYAIGSGYYPHSKKRRCSWFGQRCCLDVQTSHGTKFSDRCCI